MLRSGKSYSGRNEFLCDTHQNWCRSRDQREGYPKLFGDHGRHDIDIVSTASEELNVERKVHTNLQTKTVIVYIFFCRFVCSSITMIPTGMIRRHSRMASRTVKTIQRGS